MDLSQGRRGWMNEYILKDVLNEIITGQPPSPKESLFFFRILMGYPQEKKNLVFGWGEGWYGDTFQWSKREQKIMQFYWEMCFSIKFSLGRRWKILCNQVITYKAEFSTGINRSLAQSLALLNHSVSIAQSKGGVQLSQGGVQLSHRAELCSF